MKTPGSRAGRRSAPDGPATPPGSSAVVLTLDRARIVRALRGRSRYKYVKPRVEPEGRGWKIVSPNCSRNVDPDGGEIPIAWFEPDGESRWTLHAHDDTGWVAKAGGLTLEAALVVVCSDTAREYWR